MSTAGKTDDQGAEGTKWDARFVWKNGFNLKCGLPLTLLIERVSEGPWRRVVERKEIRLEHLGDGRVAWRGPIEAGALAVTLAERFNAYETAREFPPR